MDIEDIREIQREENDWPQFFVTGESFEADDMGAVYYRVAGLDAPVYWRKVGERPKHTTMFNFAMEMMREDSRRCRKEETPWE